MTSYGIGQLIQLVLNKGCNRIILCIDAWNIHDSKEMIDALNAIFNHGENE